MAIEIQILFLTSDHAADMQLEELLSMCLRQMGYTVGNTRRFPGGGGFVSEMIENRVQQATVVVPLVSIYFLADDKLSAIFERCRALNKNILPVLVDFCLWTDDSPFESVQFLNERTVSGWTPFSQYGKKTSAGAVASFCRQIARIVQQSR